jgi:hypothetical protein
MKEIKAQEQEAARLDAVFPCILEVCLAPLPPDERGGVLVASVNF